MSLSRKYALKLALIYAFLGSMWIFCSDWIVLNTALDPEKVTNYQNIKGLFYIIITTGLVYILANKSFHGVEVALLKKQLQTTQTASQTIFTHLGEVVFQLNPETHQVVKCNSAVTTIFGYDPGKEVGGSRSCFPLRHANGSVLQTEITLFSLKDILPQDGSLVIIIRDLTERNAMQAQLQQNQKMESIGIMASGIAHEMNNPIMVINGYADLIQSVTGENTEIQTLTEGIQAETQRINQIVNNLLGYARKDRPPQMEPFQLSEVVTKSLQLIGTNLRLDAITIEEAYPEKCADIQGYPHELQQVVLNLINNAKDALNERYPERDPDKIIRFRIRAETSPQAKVILTIEDQGMGMPPERCQHIFDPFFTTKPHGKGTGLGLWIVHEIIKKHQGSIRVQSAPERYTRFTIELPSVKPADAST